jgi:hypothetical protein
MDGVMDVTVVILNFVLSENLQMKRYPMILMLNDPGAMLFNAVFGIGKKIDKKNIIYYTILMRFTPPKWRFT